MIGYIKCKIYENHNQEKKENPQDKALRITANATVRMAIFTCLLFATSVFTALILKDQRNEMRVDQRAWLSVSDISTKWNGKSPDSFIVTVINKGKTPALKVSGRIAKCDSLTTIEGVLDNADTKQEVKDYGMVAPGEEIYVFVPISTDEIKRVRKGGEFFISGKITYRDIYGDEHWTRFCRSPHSDFNSFTIRGEHNQTDEEQSK